MVAGIDPLRDDSIIFLDRLLEAGVDAKAAEMEFMPHGFMMMKFPFS